MKEKGVYLAEADLVRQIYLKEEPVLEAVGHFHEGIEMVAVLQGEIEAFNLKHNERIKEGEIFFADSFECHHYKKITPEIKAIVLVLSNEYTSVFREIYAGKTLPTYMKNIERNVEIIKMMQQWLNEPKKNFMLNVGYSNLLFFKIVENYELQKREGKKDKAVILKLLKYINEHYLEDISLASVAKRIGYSKEYCSKIFSESVDMGFRDYLSFLRLKKAQDYFSLKKESKLTTIEIIYKCGFKSTATFYRVQKRFMDKNVKN